MDAPGIGMAWAARAPIRGRLRDIDIRLTAFAPDTALAVEAGTGGILATLTVDLVALARSRTRVQVGLELRAATMASRLMLQSLKLAKASLDKRFAKRIGEFAAEIEDRQKRLGRMA